MSENTRHSLSDTLEKAPKNDTIQYQEWQKKLRFKLLEQRELYRDLDDEEYVERMQEFLEKVISSRYEN